MLCFRFKSKTVFMSVEFHHDHNHATDIPAALQHREVSAETCNKLKDLFSCGCSAAEALQLLTEEVYSQGLNPLDRAILPDRDYVKRYHLESFHQLNFKHSIIIYSCFISHGNCILFYTFILQAVCIGGNIAVWCLWAHGGAADGKCEKSCRQVEARWSGGVRAECRRRIRRSSTNSNYEAGPQYFVRLLLTLCHVQMLWLTRYVIYLSFFTALRIPSVFWIPQGTVKMVGHVFSNWWHRRSLVASH